MFSGVALLVGGWAIVISDFHSLEIHKHLDLNHFYIYLFVSVVSSIIQQWSTEKTENGRYGMFQMVYIKVNELHVVHPWRHMQFEYMK